MKRKMIIAIAAAGLVLASVVTAVKANWTSAEIALLEANVEALVQGEAVHGVCYYSVIYLEGSKIAYCGTCTEIPGTTNDTGNTGYCN